MSLNKDQAAHDREQLHKDALKTLVCDALKQGPGFAKDIAQRAGEVPGKRFVEVLHEMEMDGEIEFSWLRGYKL